MEIEKVKDELIGIKIESAKKERDRHFASTIDTNGDIRRRIGFEFNPSTAIGNDSGGENVLTGLVDSFIVIRAGRANELRNDNPFRAIYDKSTGLRHYREVPHKHFLIFHFTFDFVKQLNANANGGSVSTVAPFTFIEGILRLTEGKIFKEKFEVAGEVGDGRNIFKNFLQALLFEPIIGITLNIEKMRHIHHFFNSSVTVSCSFTDFNRIKH